MKLLQSEQFEQLIKLKSFDPKLQNLVHQIILLKKNLKLQLTNLISQSIISEIHSKLHFIQLFKQLQLTFDEKDDYLDQLLESQLNQQISTYLFPLQINPKLLEDLQILSPNLLQNKKYKLESDHAYSSEFKKKVPEHTNACFVNSFSFDCAFN